MNQFFDQVFLHESKPIAINVPSRDVFILDESDHRHLLGLKNINSPIKSEADFNLLERLRAMGVLDNFESESFATQNEKERFRSLHIVTTTSCNLKCNYCFALVQYDDKKSDITYHDLINGINFFFEGNDHPNPTVSFYGGEALLKKDLIWKAIDHIERNLKRKIEKRIVTNATILTEDIIDNLLKYNFYVGVSIDGMQSAHNTNRVFHGGKGSFDKVIKNIELLVAKKVRWSALCAVGEHNIYNLLDHIKMLSNFTPIAIELNMPKSIGVDEQQSEEKDQIYIKSYLECIDYLYQTKIPELHYLEFLKNFFERPSELKSCAACGSQIVLSPNGKVGPCQAHVMSDKYFIERPTHISEVMLHDEFKKWDAIDNKNSPICQKCEIRTVCKDDCVMDRERRTGDMLIPSSFHCNLQKSIMSYILGRCYDDKNLNFR